MSLIFHGGKNRTATRRQCETGPGARKVQMKQILRFFVYISALGAVFVAGYHLTDVWFQSHFVRYPFKHYGIAVGLAFVFWAFALLQLAELLWSKRFVRKKTDKPYAVKVNRISEVELFK